MVFGLFKKNKKKGDISPYYEWKVKNIIPETKDTISVVFDSNDSGNKEYQSGQFLTLITPIRGNEVRRSYSLSSSPVVDNELSVTIKRVKNGVISNYLLDTLKKGDTVKVMPPMGQFVINHNEHNEHHFVMLAGGVGITPLISILKSTMKQAPKSIVSLLYCNRDSDSIIFKDALENLQKAYQEQLHITHVLEEGPTPRAGYTGKFDRVIFSKFIESIPDWGKDKTTYLMCGPEGMMNLAETRLEAHHVPKERIRKESFAQSKACKNLVASSTVDKTKKNREVTIRYMGDDHKLTVAPGQTILEVALDNGIDLPFSCQSGLCTACRGKALSGKVHLNQEGALSPEELDEGYVLTCVGEPMTDDVVIEIG